MVCPKKIARNGALMIIGSIVMFFIIFPRALRWGLKWQVSLRKGNEIRDLWTVIPFALEFKIYVFNVTNPEEILEGKKPKLQEVGPFFYDEYKEKVDVIDRKEDDSIEYSNKNTWYWNAKRSNGLTGNEEVVVPHLMMLGIIMAVMREKPSAIPMAGKAIASLFHKPESIFVKIKASDIFFGGLPIDCSGSDFAGSMACDLLKKEGKDLLMSDGNEQYRFSLLGTKNGTVEKDRVRVLRGIKNYLDVGKVMEINDKSKLEIWPDDYCNTFNGTDGTIFHAMLKPEEDLVTFGSAICRSISAYFTNHTKIHGINTLHYTADLIDPVKNPQERCFCSDPENCLGKNLLELQKCMGVPIIGSFPHFYNADEKYLQMVDGLHPNETEHSIGIDIDPMSAAPIIAHTRMQFNMFTFPIPKLKLMKTFAEALFPLFWVQEGLVLNDEWVNKVKMLVKLLILVKFLKWVLILGGFGMFGYAGFMYQKNRGRFNLDVVKVTPTNSGKEVGDMNEKSWAPGMNISTIQAARVPAKIDGN